MTLLFSGAHLCKFGKGHYEEQFCDIILNFDLWFRRRRTLKIFLIRSSGGPFLQQSQTICSNLVERIMWNNSMNLFQNWASGFRRCRLQYFLFGALAALVFSGAKPLCNFERGHHGEYSCEVI